MLSLIIEPGLALLVPEQVRQEPELSVQVQLLPAAQV
jgi:hypothetical protein